MKHKNYFHTICMALLSAMFLAACSSNEDSIEQAATNPQEKVCILHWDAPAPGFESENQTRATTDWTNGSKVYIRLKANNNTYKIAATYTSGIWVIDGDVSSIPTNTASATAEIYYFENPTSATSSRVNLSEQSIVYYGTGTYTHPAVAEFYVSVKINPMTWRMRFLGSSSAKSISLDGSNTDIEYYTSYDISTGSLSKAQKDVALTTGSNNYTPYIYGVFKNSGNNTLRYTVSNGYFYRTVKSSDLQVAGSGYCQIPTTSNYASAGWQYVANSSSANAKVEPNFLVEFTDGMVTDFKASNDVAYWYFDIFNTANNSDADVIANLKKQNQFMANQAGYGFRATGESFFSPNTTYYLYTIAYDSNGNQGELQKFTFKTKATNLPLATVSNITPGTNDEGKSTWHYDVTMSNGAAQYYLLTDESDDTYTDDPHFIAWICNYGIQTSNTNYAYGPIDWEGVSEGRTKSKLTVCTWAINSSGTVGNHYVGYYPAKSTTRSTDINYVLDGKQISYKPVNMKNYRITEIKKR